jgi:hypothetical protein
MRVGFLLIFSVLLLGGSAVSAQGVKPSVLAGEAVSVTDSKIVLKVADGNVEVVLNAQTQYKRVSPENPSLKTAVDAAFADIGAGDKLIVTGILAEDKKSIPARAVYLMTKADIAQKQTKDTERWTTRGISGRVSAVNMPANQVTIEVRGLMNTTNVIVTPKADAQFKRYAPNSVKYAEAVESSIADIKAGDMLRAVGDRGADNTTFTAEEILTGAFQTVAGTVKSVDAAKNEVVITDIQSKKDVTIDLGKASLMKKFPEEMAQRMAQAAGGGPGAGGIRPAGANPAGGPPQGTGPARGGPGGPGGPRGGIDDMLERFPNITAADLKAGDVIAVSSSKTVTPDRINAIKLLAGVEPFLRAAQANGGGGQRGGRGGTGDFNIPGLEGFGNP